VADWRDTISKVGSFRGVAFEILDSSARFGRRKIRHEYPDRDTGFVEDKGRNLREFRITATIIGDDYIAGRDALIEACERKGPGTLIHPYYGALTVDAEPVEVSETFTEGRSAGLTLLFVESGQLTFPTATPATGNLLDQVTTAAGPIAGADFADVTDTSTGILFDQLTAVAATTIVATLAILRTATDAIEDVAAFNAAVAALSYTDATRETFANDFLDVIALVPDVTAQRALAEYYASPTTVTSPTANAAQAQRNARALELLVRRGALLAYADAAAVASFGSADDATAARDDLDARLAAELAEDDINASAYDAYRDVRTRALEDFDARIINLTPLRTYEPPAITNSLAIAAELYGDKNRASEIDDRNARLVHPGFIAGEISVLAQ
jgi:prophage DNA circulation protein